MIIATLNQGMITLVKSDHSSKAQTWICELVEVDEAVDTLRSAIQHQSQTLYVGILPGPCYMVLHYLDPTQRAKPERFLQKLGFQTSTLESLDGYHLDLFGWSDLPHPHQGRPYAAILWLSLIPGALQLQTKAHMANDRKVSWVNFRSELMGITLTPDDAGLLAFSAIFTEITAMKGSANMRTKALDLYKMWLRSKNFHHDFAGLKDLPLPVQASVNNMTTDTPHCRKCNAVTWGDVFCSKGCADGMCRSCGGLFTFTTLSFPSRYDMMKTLYEGQRVDGPSRYVPPPNAVLEECPSCSTPETRDAAMHVIRHGYPEKERSAFLQGLMRTTFG